MENLKTEIIMADFVQLYRESVNQRAKAEMMRREIERLTKLNEEAKAETAAKVEEK